MDLVSVGNHYFASDGSQFEVVDFWVKEAEPWISYRNTKTGQKYECLQDAFLSRFSLAPKPRYQGVQRTL